MADSQKTPVVIASVLKPVDDTRLFEKIGRSLAEKGNFDVHIFGIATTNSPSSIIHQHPFRPVRRFSLRRLAIPWLIFFRTLRLKPRLLIVATHELLTMGVWLKWITGCRLIYDVQENYYWNILYTNAFPSLLRPFIGVYVRTKETLAARFIDHFLLAEEGYELELKFPGKRRTVLPNKVRRPADLQRNRVPLKERATLNLVFSGTLAENTGVFTAIDLAIKLHVIDDRFRLTLIGWCPRKATLERIQLLISPRPFIKLVTDSQPVPHSRVLEEIQMSDFGLITYEINPSTTNKLPTKLYEYLGYHLPILMVDHKPWVEFCTPWSAAVAFDPVRFDAAELYREMMGRTFYPETPDDVYWETEEPKLLSAIGGLGIRN